MRPPSKDTWQRLARDFVAWVLLPGAAWAAGASLASAVGAPAGAAALIALPWPIAVLLAERARRHGAALARGRREVEEHRRQFACMRAVSRMIDSRRPLADLLPEVVAALPTAFPCPDRVAVRVTLDSRSVAGAGFTPTLRRLAIPVMVEGTAAGEIELCRREDCGPVDGVALAPGERAILEEVAARLGWALAMERAVAARRDIGRRLSAIERSLGDAVITVDDTGRILAWNGGAASIFGYREHEIVGRPLTMVMPDHLRRIWPEVVLRTRLEDRRGGRTKPIEAVGLRKCGTQFPCELAFGHWRGSGRRYFSGVVRDVSERRQAERLLWHSQKIQSLGHLAGGIAHDFNNMLVPIMGLSDALLERRPTDDPERSMLATIHAASRRARDLVRRILAFSRAQEMERMPIDLAQVVGEALHLLRCSLPASVVIAADIDEGVGRVLGDAGAIQGMLMNLAINAVDAMDYKGELRVRLSRLAAGSQGADHALLVVADSGCGMSPEIMARIFEPFFTTKEAGRGTGLGLSIVQGVVERHGGAIEVDSAPGGGTAFRITLPLLDPASPDFPDADGIQAA